MGRFTLRDLGQPVSLRGALDYLVRHGWRLSEELNRIVCAGPPDDSGNPIVCLLPPNESYSDCPLRLEDLIATLSAVEERPAVEIASEMAQRFDVKARGERSLADALFDEAARRGVELAPAEDPESAIQQLRSLLRSVELATAESHSWPVLREVALLATRLARLLPGVPAVAGLLAWICEVALAEGGILLRPSEQQVDELFATALADNPDAPDRVLDWLNAHTKTVGARSDSTDAGAQSAAGLPDNQADSGSPAG